MPDISDSNWSERDDRNAQNSPNGWPPGLPASIEEIGQMMMGAIKRFWNKANPVYVTGGTLDAYTVTPESKVAFINIYEVLRLRVDRANTTTTPTLQWGDANPRTIVKVLGTGVSPLAVGDLIAGRDHSFWYNGTNYVLSNPGTVTAPETTGLLKSANNLSDVANPATSLANIGGMAKATYDPQNINADAFARANQTGTQAQSTIVNLVSDLALKAPLASPAFTGNPTVPTQTLGDNSTKAASTAYVDATAAARAVAECRLSLSGGNLLLSRLNGSRITINGVAQVIPQAGVTLSAAGQTPAQLVYIYAFMNSGTMTLEASTTAPATDATTGMQIKTGDATRTLVGMARSVTGPAWADTLKQRFVRSWFNETGVSLFNNYTVNRTTGSTTAVELNSEIRCEALVWSGETFAAVGAGTVSNNASLGRNATSFAFDGTTSELSGSLTILTNASDNAAFSIVSSKTGLAEGYHYITILGFVNSGTGTWVSDQDGRRTCISARVGR